MLKKIMTGLLSISFCFSIVGMASAATHVNGYFRHDGTYVQPHYRSDPDHNPYNNWSYPGNTNPYTGKTATGNEDTYLNHYYHRQNDYNYNYSSSYPSISDSTSSDDYSNNYNNTYNYSDTNSNLFDSSHDPSSSFDEVYSDDE